MKVLIIHQHFRLPDEGGAIRSYYLARALVQHGISVEVITARAGRIAEQIEYEGINIHYLPIGYDNRFGFWKRGRSFLQFAWGAARLGAHIPDVDLCYAISVPLTTGLSAMWLKMTTQRKFIFEVGDLWPDAPIELGFVKNPVLKQILRKLERTVYSMATAVVALSEPIKATIEGRIQDKRVCVIPNMADVEFFDVRGDDTKFRARHGVIGKFIVSYIGAIGFANGLDYLIECARAAHQASLAVHFFVCGDGALLDEHKLAAKKLDLLNLTFLPFTNREGVKELMDASDAVFVCYKPFRILETGSPNKYFDGLAAGKLILLNFEGWIKDEVLRERCGVYVDRQRPQQFVDLILPFLSDQALLHAYQHSARKLAGRYDRKALEARFVSVIENEASHGDDSLLPNR